MEATHSQKGPRVHGIGFFDLPRELRDQVYRNIALDGLCGMVQISHHEPFPIYHMSNMDAFRMCSCHSQIRREILETVPIKRILEVTLDSVARNDLAAGKNYTSHALPLVIAHEASVSSWDTVHSVELLINYDNFLKPQACTAFSQAFQLIDSRRLPTIITENEMQNVRISQLTSFLHYCQGKFMNLSTLSFRGDAGSFRIFNPRTRYQMPPIPSSGQFYAGVHRLGSEGNEGQFYEHQEWQACLQLIRDWPKGKITTVRFSACFFSDHQSHGFREEMEILRSLSSRCGRTGITWAIFDEAKGLQYNLNI